MSSYIMRTSTATARFGAPRIGADTTVAELTDRYPDTARLFRVCGIDIEASGALPLDALARTHCLELMELLRAVRRAAEFAA